MRAGQALQTNRARPGNDGSIATTGGTDPTTVGELDTRIKPMPPATARANAKKSSVRARVEHVFAHQKNRFGLFIRTIGLARAEAKLTLANLACNFDRLVFHERRAATA